MSRPARSRSPQKQHVPAATAPAVPTHATKAAIRYRYYVSIPFLHGEAKTASAGSISRVPAEIEDTVLKSLKEHLGARQDKAKTNAVRFEDRDLTQLITEIVVHEDRLVIRLKPDNADEASDSPDHRSLTIPWQKPPSRKSRQILLPHNVTRSVVRPEQLERRARLVSAIARGRRWLEDVVSGRVTTVAELCAREECSVRQVNMTISLAFLAPNLVRAAVEGRLPRGIGIERLRDPPTEWHRQLRRSDSIRNNRSAGPAQGTRITQFLDLKAQGRPTSRRRPGRGERAF
jgi:site-specific DNA recombinase